MFQKFIKEETIMKLNWKSILGLVGGLGLAGAAGYSLLKKNNDEDQDVCENDADYEVSEEENDEYVVEAE